MIGHTAYSSIKDLLMNAL